MSPCNVYQCFCVTAPWLSCDVTCHIVTRHDSGNANISPHLKCHHNYSAASFSLQVWSLRYIYCIHFQYWPIYVNFFPKNCTFCLQYLVTLKCCSRENWWVFQKDHQASLIQWLQKIACFNFFWWKIGKIFRTICTRGGKWVIMLHKMPLMLMWR